MRFSPVMTSIACLVLSACVTTEQVSFKANPGQTALQREGRPAISSVGRNSLVLLSRVGRDLPQGQRVGYVLAMQNRSGAPLDFTVQSIEAVQTFPDRSPQPIEVLTIAKLQREEQTRQAHCLIHNVTGELTAMIVAARLNVVGVADGGTDQHECAAGDHGGCG